MKILVADDDLDFRDKIAVPALKRIYPDATYILAADGYELEALLRKQNPDLVVTDNLLGGLAGSVVLTRAGRYERAIVMTSGALKNVQFRGAKVAKVSFVDVMTARFQAVMLA